MCAKGVGRVGGGGIRRLYWSGVQTRVNKIEIGPAAMRRWDNGGEGEERGNSKVLSLRVWGLIVPLIETRKSGRTKEGGGAGENAEREDHRSGSRSCG